MKHLRSLVAAGALLLAASEPLLAQGKPAAVPADRPVTAAQLVGRWGDNGDCTKDVIFRSDGTFSSYTGGGGRWSLNSGGRLLLSGPGGDFPLIVRWGGPNQLIITNPDGSVGTSQRC